LALAAQIQRQRTRSCGGDKHKALEAARLVRKNKQQSETHHKRTAERLTCDVCKSCSFETFEEAEAHETLCAAEKSLVVKFMCDVCKSCSFDTFEEAEAHEKLKGTN
jgi:hypothetical protein